MLSAMTNSGADYAPALRKAQELGYAEADPTADVEGLDARRKIVLSADLAFGVNIREEDIPCVGISSITADDIAKAKDEGLTYKLIARAEKNGRAVAAFVCPTLFSSSAPEAHTDGTGNLVTLFASRFGKQSFSGAGAGGYPTGSNVLRDCLDVAAGCRSFYADSFTPCSVNLSGTQCKWLFRCMGEYLPASAAPARRSTPMNLTERTTRTRCLRATRPKRNKLHAQSFEIRRFVARRRPPVRQGQVHRGCRPARRVVIVSAPGKRFSGDHKITDLLYLCAAHIKYGVSCEDIFAMIRDRYNEIIADRACHTALTGVRRAVGQDGQGHLRR